MKKLLSIIVSVLMLVSVMPISAFAGDTQRFSYYSNIGSNELVVTGYTYDEGSDTDINYYLVDDNGEVGARQYERYVNGEFDLPASAMTFTKIEKGSAYCNGVTYSNSYVLKSNTNKYLTIVNNAGELKLVLVSEEPSEVWISSSYFSAVVASNVYYCLDFENGSFVARATSNRYDSTSTSYYYKSCSHEDIQTVAGTAASCTQDGTVTYYHCPTCDGNYADANATDYVGETVVYAFGHSDGNGDMLCDSCGIKLQPYKFLKVTDEADIIPGGTYILVDENGKIMANNIVDDTISSVSEGVSNEYNYYKLKKDGAMIFTLKHIMNFQSWGADVSKCYGMHIDGKKSLACTGGHFYYDSIAGAKYGMKFKLNSDSSALITSWYDDYWSDGETILSFGTFTEKGETTFSMLPSAAKDGAEKSKVYLYRMYQAGTVNDSNSQPVNYTLTDSEARSYYVVDGNAIGAEFAPNGTIIQGVSAAVSEDKLNDYISSFADSAAGGNMLLTTSAEFEVVDFKESEADKHNGSMTIDINPFISDGVTTRYFKDSDLNGNTMDITIYAGGLDPEQIIHEKNDGTFEYFYPQYAEEVSKGAKIFDKVYDNEGNLFVSLKVTDFSTFTLNETPTEVDFSCKHNNYSGVVTKPATCTEDGVLTNTCTDCHDVFTEVIKATGHSFDKTKGVVIYEATCSNQGEMDYTCKTCGVHSYQKTAKDPNKHVYQSSVKTPATTSKAGTIENKCIGCGKVKSTTAIPYAKTITIGTTKYVYDGKAKKPAVTVKDSKGNKIASSNYTVTYSNNTKVGKATVKVTFKNKYKGTVSKTFTIVPKSTTISSLTALSKGFTVKWKKQATQTTGYQIQIATDSKFTKGVKSYTVTKNSTVSKKITKLTAKKKYYVRIRTYKTVSGTKYYSSWSASKYVTTKK